MQDRRGRRSVIHTLGAGSCLHARDEGRLGALLGCPMACGEGSLACRGGRNTSKTANLFPVSVFSCLQQTPPMGRTYMTSPFLIFGLPSLPPYVTYYNT